MSIIQRHLTRGKRVLKLGEYVVVTVTNDTFNHTIDYFGKLIEIDASSRVEYPENVEITIKNTALRSGAWNRRSFNFNRKTWSKYAIRIMEFNEMSLRMKISWYLRNVVFPPRYATVYTPATSLVTKTTEEEK